MQKNEKQPSKLVNPVKAQFSPSYHPMPSTYPTTSFAHSNNNKNNNSNGLSLGIRCNQLDADKFKKNGNTKSQKVSV